MMVDIKIAQGTLDLTNEERVLLDVRRKLNQRLVDVRRQRLALVEGVVVLDEKAPAGQGGGGQETRGVSTRRNIQHGTPACKRKSSRKGGAR